MMERDYENHARWKHKWERHNRGNVWEKFATGWAGKEDLIRARKMKSTLADKSKFVTFTLDRMKLSTVHRKKKGKGIRRKVKEKTPRDPGPADTSVHTRADVPTAVTVTWHVNGSMVNILWKRSTEGESAKYEKPCILDGKRRLPVQVRRLTIS